MVEEGEGREIWNWILKLMRGLNTSPGILKYQDILKCKITGIKNIGKYYVF